MKRKAEERHRRISLPLVSLSLCIYLYVKTQRRIDRCTEDWPYMREEIRGRRDREEEEEEADSQKSLCFFYCLLVSLYDGELARESY